MSAFYWPEPSFEFAAGVIDPGPTAESLYVVCHSGKVLMQFDEAQNWRAANSAEIQGYSVVEEHYMGNLGSVPCYAMEVAAPGEGEGEGEGVFRTPLHPLPALVFIGMTLAAWINGLIGAPVPTGAALATLAVGACVYLAGQRLDWFVRSSTGS